MSNCVKSGKKGCSSFALYVAVIHILLKKGRLKKGCFHCTILFPGIFYTRFEVFQCRRLIFCFVGLCRERHHNAFRKNFKHLNPIVMTKTVINFSRYTDGALESKTHSIISSMTANAFFPTPVPAIADVQLAATAFATALVKAGTGNRVEVADKNAKRETLVGLLRTLSSYVNLVANGDRMQLLSSGFEISKDPQPVTLTKPENLRVQNGLSSGELFVSVKSVRGASAYSHEYTTDATLAPDSWVSTNSTSSRLLLSNLQPGTVYFCRVGAIGSNNQLLYSDAVSRMVI
jgi:hypothetical protein